LRATPARRRSESHRLKAVARGGGWYQSVQGAAARCDRSRLAQLPPGLDIETRLSRFTAWILAAERETRAFALRLPGTHLPQSQGAGHRRAALTALALFPPVDGRDR
jgi:hypothetical protein